jgi:hypothetical protein
LELGPCKKYTIQLPAFSDQPFCSAIQHPAFHLPTILQRRSRIFSFQQLHSTTHFPATGTVQLQPTSSFNVQLLAFTSFDRPQASSITWLNTTASCTGTDLISAQSKFNLLQLPACSNDMFPVCSTLIFCKFRLAAMKCFWPVQLQPMTRTPLQSRRGCGKTAVAMCVIQDH